jgi:hypothetical protein
VQYDRRAGASGCERREPADRASFRHVRVQDVGPSFPDQPYKVADGARVPHWRDIAAHLAEAHDRHAEALGHESHRVLAVRDTAGYESRLVAALDQPGREVGHMQGGPTDIEPTDHAQDSDRLAQVTAVTW